MNRRILSLLLLFVSFSAIAQVGWERLYPIDMRYEHLTVDGRDFQDGYLRLALTTERDSAIYHHANLVKIDMKGTNVWSKDIVVADSLQLYKEGDLAVLHNENIAVSLAGLKDSLNHFIAVTDPQGELLWSKQYAVYQDSSAFDVVKPRIVQSRLDTMSLYHAAIGLYEGVQQIFVSKINATNGLTQWSNYVNIDGGELIFGSIEACREGGVIIQAIDKATEQFVVTRIDADGNLMFNKSISSSTISPTDSESNSITQLGDSTYVMVGNYFDSGVEFDGYILKMDQSAEVDWAKRVDFDFSFNNVTLLDVVESLDSNILVSGKQVGELDTAAFGIKLDYNGDLVWKSKFKVTDVENIQLGGLGQANNGGLSYFLTGGNEEAEQYIPYLITTDAEGMTLCSEELDDILFDATFSADTLELISTPFDPTFTEYCCVGNSHIGDDRDNVVRSIKEYGEFTYLLGHNNLTNGQRIGFLSKLAADGSVEWTFEMDQPAFLFEFVKTSDDNIILVGGTEPFDSSSDNRTIMINVDDSGQLIESKVFDFSAREIFKSIVVHDNAIDPTNPIYVSGIVNQSDNPSTFDFTVVLNMDNQMNVNWSEIIDLNTQDTEFDRLTCSSDGNLVSSGRTEPGKELFAKLDGLNGSAISFKTATSTSYGRRIVELSDGRYVMTSGMDNGAKYLYLLDADLNYISGVELESTVTALNSLQVGDLNTLLFSILNNGMPMVGIATVGTNGIVVSNARYFEGNFADARVGELVVEGSKINYTDSRINDDGDLDLFLYNGEIIDMFSCTRSVALNATSVSLDFVDEAINVVLDTTLSESGPGLAELDWMAEDYCENISFAECLEIDMLSRTFSGFNLPTVMLNTRNFCPEDPIVWTFYASTPGAIAYNWENEDGDFKGSADSLVVTDAELYKVTVTMGEDVCYQLCAEAEVGVFNEPTLSLNVTDNYCETGEILISTIVGTSQDLEVDSLMWSNGMMTDDISVTVGGTYSVTVTDNCGETAEADVNIDSLIVPLITDLSITDGFDGFCDSGVYTLNANIQPADAPINSSEWSTMETGLSIDIVEGNTYTVSITDYCNNLFEESITVEEIPTTLMTMPMDSIFNACQEDSVFLSVVPTYPAGFTYSWSPGGETTPSITVPIEDQTYSVVVTDVCDKVSEEVDYMVSDRDCIPIRWPNAFIPSSDLEDGVNKLFRPVIGDGTEVTDYTLKIYNRWGEIVFESDDPEEGWDGIWKENPQPGDVYLYIASYTLFDRELLDKGDLTLLR